MNETKTKESLRFARRKFLRSAAAAGAAALAAPAYLRARDASSRLELGIIGSGSRGTVDTHYFGAVSIQGEAPYPGGDHPSLFTDGAVANIKTFCSSIASDDCANPTVAPSVRSNLTCILGRIAAHERRAVTWDEMMRACAKVDGRLEGLVT